MAGQAGRDGAAAPLVRAAAGGQGAAGPGPPRLQLVRDRTRDWQRLEKLLEGALVKLSSELSSLARVKTARLILDALADGERDPKALAALALGRLRGGRADLERSLDGM